MNKNISNVCFLLYVESMGDTPEELQEHAINTLVTISKKKLYCTLRKSHSHIVPKIKEVTVSF
jgi:hypothetical protein